VACDQWPAACGLLQDGIGRSHPGRRAIGRDRKDVDPADWPRAGTQDGLRHACMSIWDMSDMLDMLDMLAMLDMLDMLYPGCNANGASESEGKRH
jgi:hypothetical protein